MELRIGQIFKRKTPEHQILTIQVIKLGVHEVTFSVEGDGVEHPARPRTLPVFTLVKWLKAMPAV